MRLNSRLGGVLVGLAFFVHASTTDSVVARYPSPGGLVTATVDGDAWAALAARHAALRDLCPDTEALLVDRTAAPSRYYLVSIDHAYRLVGLVRRHWQGLTGGPEVGREIARFFSALDQGTTARVTDHEAR